MFISKEKLTEIEQSIVSLRNRTIELETSDNLKLTLIRSLSDKHNLLMATIEKLAIEFGAVCRDLNVKFFYKTEPDPSYCPEEQPQIKVLYVKIGNKKGIYDGDKIG